MPRSSALKLFSNFSWTRSHGSHGAVRWAREPLQRAALAAGLISEARLPHWAALWETILSDKAEADELNLDRKALILRTFARLEAVAKP